MLHKEHQTANEAASTAERLIVIPRGWEVKPTGTLSHDYSFPAARRKKKKINIAHRSVLLQVQTRAGDWVSISRGTRTDDFQPWAGTLLETSIKRCSFAVQLWWHQVTHTSRFNLCHSNARSDRTCSPCNLGSSRLISLLPHCEFFTPFSFLGLLKHIVQLSTLSSKAKAIHYSMPQSTDCFCNRITRETGHLEKEPGFGLSKSFSLSEANVDIFTTTINILFFRET